MKQPSVVLVIEDIHTTDEKFPKSDTMTIKKNDETLLLRVEPRPHSSASVLKHLRRLML